MPAVRSSSSMISCSSAPAPRPHGFGMCGMTQPPAPSAAFRSAPVSLAISASSALIDARSSSRPPPGSSSRTGRGGRRARALPSAAASRAPPGTPRRAARAASSRGGSTGAPRAPTCSRCRPGPGCTRARTTPRRRRRATRRPPRRTRAPVLEHRVSASSSSARAASQTTAAACSAATSIRAQRCLTAWNWPIGRPNWCRSLAYSSRGGDGPVGDADGLSAEDDRRQAGHGARRQAGQLPVRGHDDIGGGHPAKLASQVEAGRRARCPGCRRPQRPRRCRPPSGPAR